MMSVQQILITVTMIVPTLLEVFVVNAIMGTGCRVMVEHAKVCHDERVQYSQQLLTDLKFEC